MMATLLLFKVVYHLLELLKKFPKRFQYGVFLLTKFDAFLMERLGSTPEGILRTFDFLFPRLGQRLESVGERRKYAAHLDMGDKRDSFHEGQSRAEEK